MRKRPQFILMMAALVVPVVQADLLDCVDPVVREVLINRGGEQETVFIGEMPAGFPEFDLPNGFNLVGSYVSRNNLTVAVKTRLPQTSAAEAMVEAFTVSGFKHYPRSAQPTESGFRGSDQVASMSSTTLCSADDRTTLYITTTQPRDTTYVNIQTQRASRQMACSQMQIYMARGSYQFLPDLVLPPDVTHSRRPHVVGGNDSFTTEIFFTSSRNSSQLVNFFNEQLSDQDWQHNGDWVNRFGQGSAWSTTRGTVRLSGNLRIIPRDESEYLAAFVIWNHDE